MNKQQILDLEKPLKSFFGYNTFREHQKEIVSAVLEKKDVVAILPTGSGKSICYQLPALIMPGTAIVVSPLISLMNDQVAALTKNEIPAAYISSSLHYQDVQEVLENLSAYKLLYVAPERLTDPIFLQKLAQLSISFFAIDEAHCISQWGHSFRPEYRQLALLKKNFPNAAIIALTATATSDVQADIIAQLAMTNPYVVKGSFDRQNLTIRIHTKNDPFTQLTEFLRKHPDEAGIIYASKRATVDETHAALKKMGFQVGKYHAGILDAERSQIQHAFLYDQINIMVATVAFGMGINKPNVRYIVHIDMPKTIEQYYQEIGRAGRDGLQAECLMLYSGQDLAIYKSFAANETNDQLRDNLIAKTNKIYNFCTTHDCRRKNLLRYFGETYREDNCKSCDNCLDDIELVDATVIAQKILSCVFHLKQGFGIKHVMDVLRGSKSKPVLSRGHERLSTYNLMSDCSEPNLRYYIDSLIYLQLLKISEGEYPLLQWTEKSRAVISGNEKVSFRQKTFQQPSKKSEPLALDCDLQLLQILRALRSQLAQKMDVPVFIIFSDRSLMEMCNYFPQSEQAFLRINGVGPTKWIKFGEIFLKTIKQYCEENRIIAKSEKSLDPLPKTVTQQRISNALSSSAQETMLLFQEGKNLNEIAQIRKISRGTIVIHLAEQIEKGEEINIDHLVSIEKQELIQKAIALAGSEKLAPIKEKLPEEITYDEIRLVNALYKQKQNESIY